MAFGETLHTRSSFEGQKLNLMLNKLNLSYLWGKQKQLYSRVTGVSLGSGYQGEITEIHEARRRGQTLGEHR